MMEVTTYADRSQPLIECTAVQKHYPDFALDVTLAVPENTIVGLVGLNGSGKTTLFRLLTGLAKADDGSCRMLGQAADTLPVSVKEQIGVVLADLFLQKSSVSFVLLVAGTVLLVIGVVYLFLRREKRQVLFSHETDEKLFRYLSKMMRFSQLLLIVDILFKAVQLFYSQTA